MLSHKDITLLSLNDFSRIPKIIEDGESFRENALKKARTVADATRECVLADDSGIEVDVLGGEPGIYSARYAGNGASDEENFRKLLHRMEGVPEQKRGAIFRCVLVLYHPAGSYRVFEGRWKGRITMEPVGQGGFGYDPVFFVPEAGMTVAQLDPEVKNRISHRAKAILKLKKWIDNEIKSGRSAVR